jgi:YD repeat-containing protein
VNGAATTNYIYGTTSNWLTQYAGSQNATISTDPNGSTTNNGSTGFNYDARDRMVSASTAIGQGKINALGQRVQKITPNATTVFHYDGSGKLIAESTDGALTEYVYLDDMPVAVLK